MNINCLKSINILKELKVNLDKKEMNFFTYKNDKYLNYEYKIKNEFNKIAIFYFNKIFFKYIIINNEENLYNKEFNLLNLLDSNKNIIQLITINIINFLSDFNFEVNFKKFDDLMESSNYLKEFFITIFKVFFYLSKHWFSFICMEIIIDYPYELIDNLYLVKNILKKKKNFYYKIFNKLREMKWINVENIINKNDAKNEKNNISLYFKSNLSVIVEILEFISENLEDYLKKNNLFNKEINNSEFINFLKIYEENYDFLHLLNNYTMKNFYDFLMIIILNKNFQLNLNYINYDILILFFWDILKEIYIVETTKDHLVDMSVCFNIYYLLINFFDNNTLEINILSIVMIYFFEDIFFEIRTKFKDIIKLNKNNIIKDLKEFYILKKININLKYLKISKFQKEKSYLENLIKQEVFYFEK